MDERTQKEIAECGARVREIDAKRKKLASEIEERQAEDARLVLQRDKEVYGIKLLERTLDDTAREKSWTAQHRAKRPGDPLSVSALMQQVLENYPDGLKLPALLVEVRKIGFHTDSKEPIAVLTSTLHRRKDLFARRNAGHRDLKNVRWCLTKYLDSTEGMFGKVMKGDFSNVIDLPKARS